MSSDASDSDDQSPQRKRQRQETASISSSSSSSTHGDVSGHYKIASAKGFTDIVSILIFDALTESEIDSDAQSERSEDPLIEAVLKGQAESVKALLSDGADINARDIYGRSPLNIASAKGFTDIVSILMDNGADIENKNRFGRTPLFHAAENGHVDIVKLLIGDGTRMNTQLNDETSAITASSSTGPFGVKSLVYHRQEESVKKRRKGVDIDARNIRGMSPLNVASEKGFTDIVRILLDNGAYIENRDELGRTPLLIAAMEGHIDVVKLLLGDCTGVNDGISAITAANATEHFGVKSLLQQSVADVNAEDFNGRQPIHHAKGKGLVELFIQHGANVDAAGAHGDTPLHYAVNQLNVAQLLVQHGAKLNVQNNRGKTPLHNAVQWQKPEVIMFLLSQDADVGLTDIYGNTPVHYFTSELCDGINDKGFGEYFTKILIKKHQHLLVRNLTGVSAITHATRVNAFRNAIYVRYEKFLAKSLIYVDSQGNTALHYAVQVCRLGGRKLQSNHEPHQKMTRFEMTPVCDLKLVEFLLKHGADINVQNNKGLTPLHLALVGNISEAIKACLRYANHQSFTITDKQGRNFWHLLFLSGNSYTIEAVFDKSLRHLCDISSALNVDGLNRTPLHYACMRNEPLGCYEFVKMTNDEHINEADKFGRTALHYAAINDSRRILKFLETKKVNDSIEDKFGKTYKDYMILGKAHDEQMANLKLYDDDIKDSWVQEVLAAICNDLEQHTRCQFTQMISDIRKGYDRASFARILYLGCRVNYADQALSNDRKRKRTSERKEKKRKKLTATQSSNITQSTATFEAIEDCVSKAMEYMASEIAACDSRFACEVVAVGSAYERTKIGRCDEFDYNFVLTNISRMCKVCYSPESPSGFVLLKASTSEYDEDLFNCNGTLNPTAVKFKFENLAKQILSSLSFCEKTGFELTEEVEDHFVLELTPPLIKCNACIRLAVTQPVKGYHVLHDISIDIVPAFQINDWWPDDARRRDLCQTGDCLIVFSQPQKRRRIHGSAGESHMDLYRLLAEKADYCVKVLKSSKLLLWL